MLIKLPLNIEMNGLNPRYAAFQSVIVNIGRNKFGFATIDIPISNPSSNARCECEFYLDLAASSSVEIELP